MCMYTESVHMQKNVRRRSEEKGAYIDFSEEVLPFHNFWVRFRSTFGTRFLKKQSIDKVLMYAFCQKHSAVMITICCHPLQQWQKQNVINGEKIGMKRESLNSKTNTWRHSYVERIVHHHLDGLLTTNDWTISKVTSELLIVSTCCTKTFLLWISPKKEGSNYIVSQA